MMPLDTCQSQVIIKDSPSLEEPNIITVICLPGMNQRWVRSSQGGCIGIITLGFKDKSNIFFSQNLEENEEEFLMW